MNEEVFRSRINKDLLPMYEASNGYDHANIEEFYKVTTAAEIASVREDPEVHVYEMNIPGPEGSPDIKLRIYEPVNRKEILPGMIFFHGGGWCFGSVYRQNGLCQRYCKKAQAIIISVEYRLGPQWRGPAAAEDGYATLCWLTEHGAEIGVDSKKIGLVGVSAGGNIAAAVSFMAKDRGGPAPLFQMPLCAGLDHRMGGKSFQEITSPKVMSYQYVAICWSHYVTPGEEPSCYTSPALREDLSGLPPTFAYIGQLDPMRDENVEFWQRLMEAGVDVEFHVYPGCFHGFELGCPDSEYGSAAIEATCAYARKMFAEAAADNGEALDFQGSPA